MHNRKTEMENFIRWYLPVAISFAAVFVFLRLYEYATLPLIPKKLLLEAAGSIYDLLFSFKIISIILFIGLGIATINGKAAKWITSFLLSVILTAAFLLIAYFSSTNVLLNTDVYGYSIEEIRATVLSSEGNLSFTIAALGFYLLIFHGLMQLATRINLPGLALRTAAVTGVILLLVPFHPEESQFQNETEYNVVENKTRYFVHTLLNYLATEKFFPYNGDPNIATYPFIRKIETEDVLGPLLHKCDSTPNFCFIIIEGMGRDFMGPDAMWRGFTPFLDSLATQSLFWENGISNAGRTFGALPSILGSPPYGDNGFMSYGVNMPSHRTLISILKNSGYSANFFYGGNADFDEMDMFMQYQGVDYMLNESNFPPAYAQRSDQTKASWGYPDRSLFHAANDVLFERKKNEPRIDVYLTLSTHEPFVVPEKEFNERASKIIEQETDSLARQQKRTYADIFSTILYTDDAIRNFFELRAKANEHRRTIYIITGDHRLIPVTAATKLSRFRVPIIIYSPLLKKPKTFKSAALHSDIAPSILKFLSSQYAIKTPTYEPFLSHGLRTDSIFTCDLNIGMMRGKGNIQDYIHGNYYYSEGKLYLISGDMNITPLRNDSILTRLRYEIKKFSWLSKMVCAQNRWDSVGSNHLKLFKLSAADKEKINDADLREKNGEEIFHEAQQYAIIRDFNTSRVFLKYLLNTKPNYHDARILLARTYAWNAQYDSAQLFINQVLERSPYYEDAFNAMSDIAYWQADLPGAKRWVTEGLKLHPTSNDLLARQARSYLADGNITEARKIITEVLTKDSDNDIALELSKKMTQ